MGTPEKNPARKATVLILLEPERGARIIPVVDEDCQETDFALLLKRALLMIEADPEVTR